MRGEPVPKGFHGFDIDRVGGVWLYGLSQYRYGAGNSLRVAVLTVPSVFAYLRGTQDDFWIAHKIQQKQELSPTQLHAPLSHPDDMTGGVDIYIPTLKIA